jgi:hypothetical protein
MVSLEVHSLLELVVVLQEKRPLLLTQKLVLTLILLGCLLIFSWLQVASVAAAVLWESISGEGEIARSVGVLLNLTLFLLGVTLCNSTNLAGSESCRLGIISLVEVSWCSLRVPHLKGIAVAWLLLRISMASSSFRELLSNFTLCSYAWLWVVEDLFFAKPNCSLWLLLSECCSRSTTLALLFSLLTLEESSSVQDQRVYMTERLHWRSLSLLNWTSGILKIEVLCKHKTCHLRITLDLRGDSFLHNAIIVYLCAAVAVISHVSVSIFFFLSQ